MMLKLPYCCDDCRKDEEAGLIDEHWYVINKAPPCAERSKENEILESLHYDEEYKKKQKEFMYFLRGDRNNLSLFTGKLKELNDILDTLKERRYRLYRFIPHNEFQRFKKELKMMEIKKVIEKVEADIKQIDFFRRICQGKQTDFYERMVSDAKMIPISTIITTKQESRLQNRITYVCPIHNEKTGSFVWYIDQNKFHCFGCQAHGDSIDLYMKLYNVNFQTAVRELARGG